MTMLAEIDAIGSPPVNADRRRSVSIRAISSAIDERLPHVVVRAKLQAEDQFVFLPPAVSISTGRPGVVLRSARHTS